MCRSFVWDGENSRNFIPLSRIAKTPFYFFATLRGLRKARLDFFAFARAAQTPFYFFNALRELRKPCLDFFAFARVAQTPFYFLRLARAAQTGSAKFLFRIFKFKTRRFSGKTKKFNIKNMHDKNICISDIIP
jgi:hypothetical protein